MIDRCTLVEENQAIDGGGAIYVSDSSVEVRGAQITHNYALYDGGGLALDGAANASLIGVLVANNSAGGDGGAVSVTGASIVTLSSVNMSDNTAAGDGGAISATSTSTVLITSATSATSNASSAPAFATTGDCVVTDECISSPNYPNDYGNSEACTITPQRSKIVLSVTSFETESCCDYMTIDGVQYQGTSGPDGVVVTPGTSMTWYSDGSISSAGWKICVAPEATCGPFSTMLSVNFTGNTAARHGGAIGVAGGSSLVVTSRRRSMATAPSRGAAAASARSAPRAPCCRRRSASPATRRAAARSARRPRRRSSRTAR